MPNSSIALADSSTFTSPQPNEDTIFQSQVQASCKASSLDGTGRISQSRFLAGNGHSWIRTAPLDYVHDENNGQHIGSNVVSWPPRSSLFEESTSNSQLIENGSVRLSQRSTRSSTSSRLSELVDRFSDYSDSHKRQIIAMLRSSTSTSSYLRLSSTGNGTSSLSAISRITGQSRDFTDDLCDPPELVPELSDLPEPFDKSDPFQLSVNQQPSEYTKNPLPTLAGHLFVVIEPDITLLEKSNLGLRLPSLPKRCDRYGNTDLHAAAFSGLPFFVLQIHIDQGADVNATNTANQTFMHMIKSD